MEIQWLPGAGLNKQTNCPDCGETLLFPGYDEEKVEKYYSEDHIMTVERLDERIQVGASIYNAAVRCSHCGHAYLTSFKGGGAFGDGWSLRLIFSK